MKSLPLGVIHDYVHFGQRVYGSTGRDYGHVCHQVSRFESRRLVVDTVKGTAPKYETLALIPETQAHT